ncbi:lipoate--protein ligase family protein [Pyxidicoccus sp. MSG2]|uniref:lipoate--protein ligase family protein n=1 Tax=Pyxidicoccus sp. MSG2 TaxID=2996790 RepID=UPI002271E196|nr:biotin/lipoate A/B protein ligase family protein [Pyxidicoccus sp. MSG2]MCY1018751.1 biotin/lipoate A/B protein ligase family protein [Pyxidicoccus sp. MSG2]
MSPSSPAEAPRAWNVIEPLEESPGSWQMALDEAQLDDACARADFVPTLRLYVFRPGCLSLGRTQSYESVDAAAAKEQGLELVRRVTGGSGVLHHGELTYSFIARVGAPFADSIEQNYTLLSEAIAAGLASRFGVRADLEPSRPERTLASGACFLTPALKELKVNGRKLVGSAQRRQRGAFMQHGALPLVTDYALHARLFGLEPERLRGAMMDLKEAAGREVSHADAAEALKQGFTESLGAQWTSSSIAPHVRARAEALVAERYGREDWTRDAL